MPIPEAISNYLKYLEFIKNCSKHTLKAYSKDLSQVFNILSLEHKNFTIMPNPESDRNLMEWARLAQTSWSNLTPASRNRKTATLKSFFQFLYQKQLLETDLAQQLHSPKVPFRLPHFLSVDEILTCLQTLNENPRFKSSRHLALFLAIYGGGLRIQEACSLEWKNINWDQKTFRILGKGNKERLISVPPRTLEALRAHQPNMLASTVGATIGAGFGLLGEFTGLKSPQYVFDDLIDKPRRAYQMIRDIGKVAGLMHPLNPHALRHSYATHLLVSGANLRVLQQLLGHESLRSTEKYTHLDLQHLAQTLEKYHPRS